MKAPFYIYLLLSIAIVLIYTRCERDIDIDVPQPETMLVVEGTIETGSVPFVIITRSSAYFSESSSNDLYNFVHDAEVTVIAGQDSIPLMEICSSEIPDEFLPILSQFIGVVLSPESGFDFCIYTDPNILLNPEDALLGENGKSYRLFIQAEGKTLTSKTSIPKVVPLDSAWFEVEGNLDSLGFAWALFTDPDTSGNAYRWYAQRINSYPDGTQKDPVFIAPFASAVDDRFFNGLTFEFVSARGSLPFSNKEDDENEEVGFFKVGDTIAVKACSIDYPTYLFVSSFYSEIGNQGSPFANPASLKSNVDGGLGVWAGYGVFRDTIIATR
jgi:hypothetical protein